jgi:hypothetical protein
VRRGRGRARADTTTTARRDRARATSSAREPRLRRTSTRRGRPPASTLPARGRRTDEQIRCCGEAPRAMSAATAAAAASSTALPSIAAPGEERSSRGGGHLRHVRDSRRGPPVSIRPPSVRSLFASSHHEILAAIGRAPGSPPLRRPSWSGIAYGPSGHHEKGGATPPRHRPVPPRLAARLRVLSPPEVDSAMGRGPPARASRRSRAEQRAARPGARTGPRGRRPRQRGLRSKRVSKGAEDERRDADREQHGPRALRPGAHCPQRRRGSGDASGAADAHQHRERGRVAPAHVRRQEHRRQRRGRVLEREVAVRHLPGTDGRRVLLVAADVRELALLEPVMSA